MANPEIDQMIQYTKQFIEAATPIAKQAYEIGLVTLRIDAAQQIVLCLVGIAFAFLIFRKIKSDYAAAKVVAELPENRSNAWKRMPSNNMPCDGLPHILGALIGGTAGIIATLLLVNLWLWVKLFSPQLWLAHMAVEKIVG